MNPNKVANLIEEIEAKLVALRLELSEILEDDDDLDDDDDSEDEEDELA